MSRSVYTGKGLDQRSQTSRVVRKATPDDAPGIASVHMAVQREIYQGIFPMDSIDSRPYIEERDREPVADLLLAYRAATRIDVYPTIWRFRLLLTSRVWEPGYDTCVWPVCTSYRRGAARGRCLSLSAAMSRPCGSTARWVLRVLILRKQAAIKSVSVREIGRLELHSEQYGARLP